MTKSEYQKKWRMQNKEKVKMYAQKYKVNQRKFSNKYYKNNKNKALKCTKNWNLKKKYGITIEQYNQLHTKQGGLCAICQQPQSKYKRNFHVDHDHSNGKVRGLLCVKCNYGIGCFNENLELFDKVKDYIMKYK
jgi:hypothetical protein